MSNRRIAQSRSAAAQRRWRNGHSQTETRRGRLRLAVLSTVLLAAPGLLVGGSAARRRITRVARDGLVADGRNLALRRPYTLNRLPDYPGSSDPARSKLTDGVYTQGYFWTQPTTDGWTGASDQPVVITVDLGRVESIGGASYSTAAGTAGVHWPSHVFVLTSDDDSTWFLAGDLVSLDRATGTSLASDHYATHRFTTAAFATRGRYLAFVVDADSYVFCDEVEVLAGGTLPKQPQGRQVPEPLAFYRTDAAMRRWLDAVAQRAGGLPDASRRRALLTGTPAQVAATFTPRVRLDDRASRLIVPYTREQEELFALNGRTLHESGAPALRIWKLHRYDPLDPIQSPSDAAAALSIECMNGEWRADALVLTNGTAAPQSVHLRVTGLPGGTNPAYLGVDEVEYVQTRSGFVSASALKETSRADGDFVVTIPAGMNRQVWFSVRPAAITPGDYQGTVDVLPERSGAGIQKVPFALRISALTFPPRPRVHLGGWDYTNGKGANDITPANRDRLVQFLQPRFVDAPWATSSVLGHPAARDFNEDGSLRGGVDLSELDEWIARWRGARLYLVYVDGGNEFAGRAAGTPAFDRCIGTWLRAVAARFSQHGVNPSQVGLLLVDEPSTDAQAARIRAWADAVHRSGTGILVWEDPQFRDLGSRAAVSALAASDIVSPDITHFLAMSPRDRETVRQAAAAKRFWLYDVLGPAHSLDPYAYYELHFWVAFALNAEGVDFWSFSDAGGGNAWNEHASPHLVHTPEYLAPDAVSDSKQMMAIVEGVEDFEYLSLLRDRLATHRADTSAVARDAARLLAAATDSVQTGLLSTRDLDYDWTRSRDRAVADRMRQSILHVLESFANDERH